VTLYNIVNGMPNSPLPTQMDESLLHYAFSNVGLDERGLVGGR